MKTFSIDQAVRTGWERMKKNFWFFVLVMIVVWAISAIFSGLAESTINISFVYFLLVVINIGISALVSLGLLKISLLVNDEKKAGIRDLFIHYPLLWRFFLASLLKGLIIIGGTILLIIPGVYWSLKFRFVEFLIVDKKMGVMESFRESARMTDGLKWSILGFEIVSGIITILGALALLLGLFAAIPTVLVARANMYRTISAEAKKG